MFDNKITSMKEDTVDAVVCPAKTIQEHCDDKTGIWTQTTTFYILDGCDCKKKEKVKVGKCGECYNTIGSSLPPMLFVLTV